MPRAVRVLGAGEVLGPIHDTLIIDAEARRGRQPHVVSNSGVAIELDLPQPVFLRTDDVLALDTGELVSVVAAPEPLFEVRADFALLARIAWALGDRHVPVQFLPNRLRLPADDALRALIAGLGGKVTPIKAPFEPEGGAYEIGATAPHDHHHHDHAHHHVHNSHEHIHGPDRKR